MAGEQLLYNRPLPGARLNMAHPLARGLVGCWLLNEQMGLRAMDLSPYGNHGTLIGFPAGAQRSFRGLSFDGTNDYVDAGTPERLVMGLSDFSVSAWAKTPIGNAYMGVAGKGEWTAADDGYGLAFDSIGKMNLLYGVNKATATPIAYGDDRWHHFVGTADRDGLGKIYVDGHEEKSADISAEVNTNLNNPRNFKMGDLEGAGFFSGLIGAVLVFNRVLMAQESVALYLNPYTPYGLRLFL